jgi:hypothetical protein
MTHPPIELEQFARFCRKHLRLEDGRPLEIEDFQRTMLGQPSSSGP